MCLICLHYNVMFLQVPSINIPMVHVEGMPRIVTETSTIIANVTIVHMVTKIVVQL